MAINPKYSKPPHPGGPMSFQEYLTLERSEPFAKYEYLNGIVRLMAGGSSDHADISLNIQSELRQQFLNGPCHVFNSEMKVLIGVKPDGSENRVFPDATVTCNVDDRRRGNHLVRSPVIVVEVLSPSTEAIDRGEKLAAYKACETIQEILLVSQFSPYVEVYSRDEIDRTKWTKKEYGPGETVMLNCMDIEIEMDEIYRGIDFDEPLIEE